MLSNKSKNAQSSATPSNRQPMLEDYPELLTVQHIASITGLSEQTIRPEINSGKIPGCRIGRRLFVPKSSFIDYMHGRC